MKKNRNIYLLSALSLVLQLTIAMINFVLVYLLSERNFSPFLIGLSASVIQLTYFITCIIFSKFDLCISGKTKVVFGLILMGLSDALILMVPVKSLSFLFFILNGFSQAFLWPAIEELITSGQDRKGISFALSMFNLSWSFGSGVSTVIGGLLGTLSPSLPFGIAILLFVFMALYVVVFFRKNSAIDKSGERGENDTKLSNLRYFSWVTLFFIYLGYGSLLTVFPLYAKEELGFSESLTGLLLFGRGITVFFVFLFITFFKKKDYTVRTNIFTLIGFLVVMNLISINRNAYIFAFLFVLYGIFFGLSYDASISNGAKGDEKNRGRRMFFHEACLTLGTLIGNSLGGLIYEKLSFRVLFEGISLISLVAMIIEFPFMYKLNAFSFRLTKGENDGENNN